MMIIDGGNGDAQLWEREWIVPKEISYAILNGFTCILFLIFAKKSKKKVISIMIFFTHCIQWCSN